MARQAKKQAPAKVEEDDDDEGWEDAVVDTDEKAAQNLRLRDWRDVERFREMKELRRLVDDDYGLEEIFHIPLKPRAEPGIPAPHTPAKMPKGAPVPAAKPAKGAPAKAVPVKAAPAKAAPGKHPAAKLVHHAKAVKAKAHKAPAKLKGKAKRK